MGFHVALKALFIGQDGTSSDVSSGAQWSVSPANSASVTGGILNCTEAGVVTVSAGYNQASGSMQMNCMPSSLTTPTKFIEEGDEFPGPFASWLNLKTQFGAVGDGQTDDTNAIQAALDFLKLQSEWVSTLWIPKGTYRITRPLVIHQKFFFSIVGEDPTTTKLLWGGPAGGSMLIADGATVFRITRLTFDGANLADTAEELTAIAPGGSYTTFNELSDQHLVNLNHGIKLTTAAETTIERVYFDGIADTGILLGSFNVANIFINDSLFVHCGTGVSNNPGAGSFNVSNSFFEGSTVADFSIGNTSYFSVRHTTSIGSAAFFLAGNIGSNNAQITLQGNTIIDPLGTPIKLGDTGALMLIDNVVRMEDITMPAVLATQNTDSYSNIFSMGNIFTSSNPITAINPSTIADAVTTYDDAIVDSDSIATPSVPATVFTPQNAHRAVFEVPPGSTGDVIQAVINAAVASGSEKPIVHLPASHFNVTHAITIPPGTGVQLIGDDLYSSVLCWFGDVDGAVLSVQSAQAKLSQFSITTFSSTPTTGVTGIDLQLLDQPGSRLFVDQLYFAEIATTGIAVNGVEQADLTMMSTYTVGNQIGYSVTGGIFENAGEETLGRVNHASGSIQSAGDGVSIALSHSGRFLVQDDWHDGNETSPHHFILTDSGTLTLQGGGVFMNSDTPFVMNNFQGKVSLLGLQFSGGFDVQASTNLSKLLVLGSGGDSTRSQPTPNGEMEIHNVLNQYYYQGAHRLPSDTSSPSARWMREMLGQTRREYATSLVNVGNQNIIRVQRVGVNRMGAGLAITPTSINNRLFYQFTSADGDLNFNSAASACMTTEAVGASTPQWLLLDAGDGDMKITVAGTNGLFATEQGGQVLLLASANSDNQHWRMLPSADGRYQLINRATGKALRHGGGSGCLSFAESTESEATLWSVNAH